MAKFRPVPASFMVLSIIGLLVSAVYTVSGRFYNIWGDFGDSMGFAFIVLFIIMLVASVVSITPRDI